MTSPRGLLWLAIFLTAAAPGPKSYPLKGGEDVLIVPASSPVAFTNFDELTGNFEGRFILSGLLIYGCRIECDHQLQQPDLALFVIPDEPLARTLPHWQIRHDEVHVYFDNDTDLAAKVVSDAEQRALLSRKTTEVRKRVSLVVADFRLSIDCDSAYYHARFVSVAKPSRLVKSRAPVDTGCS